MSVLSRRRLPLVTLVTSALVFGFAAHAVAAEVRPRAQVVAAVAGGNASCPAWLNQEFRKLHSSQKVNLCQLAGNRPLLVVNTASHCGYTPQFKGLEAVHAKYRARGLVVVGFSSDDFNQEAKDEAAAADTCFLNYGVTFTMLAPQPVKGTQANVVFRELARQSEAPSWNFNKYLVGTDGRVAHHFDGSVAPGSAEFTAALERLLQ